jgi:hypothetical protein
MNDKDLDHWSMLVILLAENSTLSRTERITLISMFSFLLDRIIALENENARNANNSKDRISQTQIESVNRK